jgi:hypothetical protein
MMIWDISVSCELDVWGYVPAIISRQVLISAHLQSRELYLDRLSSLSMKLISHFHIVSRLRMYGTLPSFPIYLDVIMLKHRDSFTFNFVYYK